jgi:hypothetical protein
MGTFPVSLRLAAFGLAPQDDPVARPASGGASPAGVDVYLAGLRFAPPVTVAMVWKNGATLWRSSGAEFAGAEAVLMAVRGLAASGSDLYAVGYGGLLADRPRVWKNGRPQATPRHGTGGANATSVAVSGTDLYVAGWETAGGRKTARVWKNGESLELPGDPGRSSEVHALALAGTDVYSAGNLALETGKAAVWRNGQAALVGTGQRTEIKAIFLRQED